MTILQSQISKIDSDHVPHYRSFLRKSPSVNRPMGLFMENFPLVGPWAYYQQDKMTFYETF